MQTNLKLEKMSIEELNELKRQIQSEIDLRKSDIVIVNIKRHSNSGNRKSWLKTVKSIDDTKRGGYAFNGDFLDTGEHELRVGEIVIECYPCGSVKNGWNEGIAYSVQSDGELKGETNSYHWKKEFVSFRNDVAKLLER